MFATPELRVAVEYLKTMPRSRYVGLIAMTQTGCRWPDGRVMFRLNAQPMLLIDKILGKTPAETWALFDRDVDEQRKGLARRFLGKDPSSWEVYLEPF